MKFLILFYMFWGSIVLSQELPSDRYWRFGENTTIAVYGDTLLCQNGYVLEIHNISDKANPVWISSTQLQDEFSSIKIWNNYAFCLLKSQQLVVVDISNLTSLKVLAVFENNILDFYFYKNTIVLAKGWQGFCIYDLADVAAPQEITTYTFDRLYSFNGIDIYDDLLYFNCSDHILIFDGHYFPQVSLISNINLSDSISGYISIKKLLALDKFIYVSAKRNGLITINISDIKNAQITSITKYDGVNEDYEYQDLLINENNLLVGTSYYVTFDGHDLDDHYGDGIHVFDISNRASPKEKTKLFFSNYYKSTDFTQKFSSDKNTIIATFGSTSGYNCIDITSLNNTSVIGNHKNSSIKTFVPYKDLIYFPSGKWGLSILMNPHSQEITELKRINVNGNATSINRFDKHLFVGVDSVGVLIFTLDEPENPTQISLIPSSQPNFVYADKFMLTWDGFSIKIYNTTDLSNPIFINEFCSRNYWSEQISEVFNFQDFIVVVPKDDSEYVEIFDITDLNNPRSVYQVKLNNYIFSKTTFQKTTDYLYINEYYNNYIYNISDLNNIELVYSNYFPLESRAVLRGELLYLQSSNLSVYNIFDFSNPELLSQFDFDMSWNFFFYDNFIFHRNGPYGNELMVYQINDETDIELLESIPLTDSYLNLKESVFHNKDLINRCGKGIEVFEFNQLTHIISDEKPKENVLSITNYPNPFNPHTTIEYTVVKPSIVKIILYDILGRKVKTIINEYRKVGVYKELFDANSLVSGTYYCQIQSENKTKTKPMILLK